MLHKKLETYLYPEYNLQVLAHRGTELSVTKSPQRPTPNVHGRLQGDASSPWITLRSTSETLVPLVGQLKALLAAIDGGLEVMAMDDGRGLRVQPKSGMSRTRPELFAATRRLAQSQSQWLVKWDDD
jgi:hypothetical protein